MFHNMPVQSRVIIVVPRISLNLARWVEGLGEVLRREWVGQSMYLYQNGGLRSGDNLSVLGTTQGFMCG